MNALRRQPLEAALCVILVTIVTITLAQVVFRYVLQLSLTWSEELARFLLMWLAALSSAYAFKVRSHFALHFVVDRFDERIRQVIGTLVSALVSLFLIVFAWESAKFILAVRDQIAPGTGMSMAIPYSSALAGSLLMLYYVVKNWCTGAGLSEGATDEVGAGADGPDAAGGHQQKAVGDVLQLAPADDHRLAMLFAGGDQLVGKADPPAKIDAPRHVGDEIIGTGLDQETAVPLRSQHPADSIRRFQQSHIRRSVQLNQPMRRRQPGNPPANDPDVSAHGDQMEAPPPPGSSRWSERFCTNSTAINSTFVSPHRRLRRRCGETSESAAASVVQQPWFRRGKPGGDLFCLLPSGGLAASHCKSPRPLAKAGRCNNAVDGGRTVWEDRGPGIGKGRALQRLDPRSQIPDPPSPAPDKNLNLL